MTLITYSRPAKFDKTILLASDANYFPYMLFFANQLHEHHPDRDFDICVICPEDLPSHPLIEQIGLRVCKIDVGELGKSLPLGDRIPIASYLRLIAPDHLQEEYRRILYLDVDMFILRNNLSDLLDLDIHEFALAAVRSDTQIRNPKKRSSLSRTFNTPQLKEFNAGLLLIDTKKFCTEEIGQKAVLFASENPDLMKFHDQTALNCVLQGNWAELPQYWNFRYNYKTVFFTSLFNPIILHFTSSRKPWSNKFGPYSRRFTEPYRDFFRIHFPELAPHIQRGSLSKTKWYLFVIILLMHAFKFRSFMRHENYSKSDWDVKFPGSSDDTQ